MTIPYDRIRSRIDCQAVPCLLCGRVTIQQVVDHCHEHGWTRGILCVSCNNRMGRVDADLSRATSAELFHRDNCPDCRREGYAGLERRVSEPSRSPRLADAVTTNRLARKGQVTATPVVSIEADLAFLAQFDTAWSRQAKAVAARHIDSILPGRVASHVVALLAAHGVDVDDVFVRKVRSRLRQAERAVNSRSGSSQVNKPREVTNAAPRREETT